MGFLKGILARLRGVGLTPEEIGIAGDVESIQMGEERGRVNHSLVRIIDEEIAEKELELSERGFLEPSSDVSDGKIHVLTTEDETEVKVSFREGQKNRLIHLGIAGSVGSGKTRLQAQIASQAAQTGHPTLILDVHKGFRTLDCMRKTHQFVHWKHLRLNPFDSISGVEPAVVDQTVLHEIAGNYGLIFAEHEGTLALEQLRGERIPTLPHLIEHLQNLRYQGFSRRSQYRDSLLLVLSSLVTATNQLFMCSRGMNVQALLGRNQVIELDGMLPQHLAFVTRFIFEYVHLLSLGQKDRSKEILVFIDEAQVIAKERNFSDKLLQLRHSGIHLIENFQNLSEVPIQVLGNVDGLFCFQTTDQRDSRAIAQAARLTPDQQSRLAILDKQQCLCFLPRLDWKHPFLGTVPHVADSPPDDAAIDAASEAFLRDLAWEPLQESGNGSEAKPAVGQKPKKSRIEVLESHLIADILNQAHKFSPWTVRLERTGIRSVSTGNAIQKRLIDRGLINVKELPLGKGRPVMLCEPTEKLLDERGITWDNGLGELPTQAATWYAQQEILKCEGWSADPEGVLYVPSLLGEERKQVDLLCRDPEGRIVTVEIAGSFEHEAHNAIFCIRSGQIHRHVVVALKNDILSAVKRSFKAHPELNGNPIITLTTLSTILKEGWRP